MRLTNSERETYAAAFALPHYGNYSPGEQYAQVFASMAEPGASVIDAGCGSGKGMIALDALGFVVEGCDLTSAGLVDAAKKFPFYAACLWRPLGVLPARYVYCTDVLEHIPPQFTMAVVQNLLHAATDSVFLSISLVPDINGIWLGRPLHLSVRRYDEWLTDFREMGTVTDARDLGTTGLYMVKA